MVFSIERETKQLVASLPRGDGREDYDCVADACRNPACRCLTMTIAYRARAAGGAGESAPAPERTVALDLGMETIDGKFRTRASPSDLAFAEAVLAAMEPADFDLLGRIHFMIKSRETELAQPAEIDARFDFDEIERSSLMQAYNDILPFAETMHVVVDGIEHVVLDQYCVRPRCRCTDAHINLLPITEGSGVLEPTDVVSVDYAGRTWGRVENEPLSCDIATLRRLMESTIPDLYAKLNARHQRLRAIYAHCRKRARTAVAGSIPAGTVGRNDPCPCGSGKKLKKCCLGKGTGDPSARHSVSTIAIRH